MTSEQSLQSHGSPALVRTVKYFIQLSGVGAVYFVIARFGLDLASLFPGAIPIWAPTGFALAAVLLGGYRVVPAIFLAGLLANTVTADLTYPAVAIAAGNTLEALAGGYLVNRWAEGRNAFAASTGIAKFVLIAMFATAISASVGASVGANVSIESLNHAEYVNWGKFASIWLTWWLGDLAAALMITPVLVLWATDRPRSFDLRPLLETSAIFVAASAVGLIVFSPLMAETPNRGPLGVLAILPPMWAALRRGPRDTATAALILSSFAAWGTIFGGSPFAQSVRNEPSMLLLMFMIGITVPSVTLGADAMVRRRTEKMLRDARQELEQTRQQFAQAQKMEAVGQLTGGVAHDFNNLLTVIVGNLEIAQRHLESWTEGPAERLRRVINNAMRGAQRATTITQRLLAFSRKQPLDPKPLNVNNLLKGLSDFLRRSLGEMVGLEIVGAGGLWRVEADPIQLESAVLNLAVNARDAMSAGGKLTIETSNSFLDEQYCRRHAELVAGEYVQIAVSDTGAGMSKEILERVFEPFFTTKVAGQGTGLGLSQVYGFVKQSCGHIHIDSEPGVGTTVKIYLPRLFGDIRDDVTAEREVAGADVAETILLVEDDHDVRAYVVETLRELHYRVLEAHDAESALAMIDRNDVQVDLLLTDVVLPGMNGRELANEVKARQPGIRILFMTGYSQDAIVHDGRLDPGVELMQKPLTQEVLAERIRGLLDSAR
jgi:signal transduction histidine kinase